MQIQSLWILNIEIFLSLLLSQETWQRGPVGRVVKGLGGAEAPWRNCGSRRWGEPEGPPWAGGSWQVHSCCSVAKSCLTPCHPMDRSLPASSVHGILQARILGWVAIPFSDSGIELGSPALQADSLPSEPPREVLSFPRGAIIKSHKPGDENDTIIRSQFWRP